MNMATTIYKYTLQLGRTVLDMPDCARALSVQMQGEHMCLWARVEPRRPTERRIFDVYGTGHPMPADPGDHVGTVQVDGLVWHVFDASPQCLKGR